MRKALVKGSKEAKAFMAKLRAKKASATKSIKNVATNVKRVAKGAKNAFREGYYAKDKVGEIYYYGSGGMVLPSQLKIGEKYEWIIGAEYLEVKYIGLTKDFPKLQKTRASFGDGRYLFQFVKDKDYVKISFQAVREFLRTIPKIGSTLLIEKGENPRKKPTRVIQVDRTKKGLFKKFSKVSGVNHKDTKSHNVNISVVSGVVNIMDVKRDLDKSILLLESAKMATIDKNNTNYLTQNKPLVFKNITEKKSFIKQYTKQVKILKDLYKNTLKNKLNK